MPTKHPRLNIVLEPPVYRSVKQLAKRDGVSLSLKARDLIRDALELYEDAYLAERAHERAATFDRGKALTHEQVWAHLKRRRR
jgi:predicted DNA-binding protein